MPICRPQPHVFDKMAKALTSGVSRRDAFKYVGAGVLGTLLVSVGVREAEAVKCIAGGSCSGQVECTKKPGQIYCGCTHMIKNNGQMSPKGYCWQNQFCSGLTPCTSSADCVPLGKSYKCADSCCGGGFCLPKCGSVPPCCSTQGGSAKARH
jgi:hypothetical protein